MTVLRGDINARTTNIRVDAPIVNPSYPFFRDIDDETVKVVGGADTTEWQVERGVGDSQQTRHAKNVALVDSGSPFGGSPSLVFVSPTDPGAIGAYNQWIRTDPTLTVPPSLIIRNGADDGWLDDNDSGYRLGLVHYDGGNKPKSAIRAENSIYLTRYDTDQGVLCELTVSGSSITLTAPGGISLTVSDSRIVVAGIPTADPEEAGALYTDGAPSAGVPKALMVSGGPA